MEEGSLRCDANVSIRPGGQTELGTKTELKNMNSFRFIERGIDAELERQHALVEAGDKVTQETLHYDPRSGSITSLRSKEEAHDYRYFPEPDLVPLAPTEEMLSEARAALPELPAEREERYVSELAVPDAQARQLARDPELGAFFEEVLVADGGASPGAIANWVSGEAAGREAEPAALASLVAMVEDGKVTTQAAKQVLAKLVSDGGDPAEIAEREGLGAMEDSGELEEIVDRALEAHPEEAQKMKEGGMQAIGPVIGFVMRETKGAADGKEVTALIRAKLGL
jgi:aspartyl-tRNA(Asn)/glutamyl-tRNA(Gln) amidotransferase subunit B